MNLNYSEIDGKNFEEMLTCGYAKLKGSEDAINKLNVFPVPDGDTGSNMRMTYEAGLNALRLASTKNIGEAAAVFARGMLLGARGNSGVILSQIFKGIAIGLEGLERADCKLMSRALKSGVDRSYKAVVKPVEGTILTVFRECSEYSQEITEEDISFCDFSCRMSERCKVSLDNTPNLLAVLKEAGVIDSGGAGLLSIFNGIKSYFSGEEVEEVELSAKTGAQAVSGGGQEFGYCTEFLLSLSPENKGFEVGSLVKQLENIGGESIVALRDDDIVKVHVHVKTPGDVLNIAQQYGEFISLKIENMTVQHNELITSGEAQLAKKDRVKTAVVAVASGVGFKNLFTDMGADFVIEGGQSMNPSVEEFLEAFDKVNAEDIIVLPNNSNVILTARQSGEIYSGGRVHVLESKTLSQGYAALSIYNPDEDADSIFGEMNDAKSGVASIEITRAVRDAVCDGVSIKKGQAIAVVNGRLAAAKESEAEVFKAALGAVEALSDKCVITLFTGEDATDDITQKITDYIAANCAHLEVCVIPTGQRVYSYVVAVE